MIAHNISIRYTGNMASIGAMHAGYVDRAMAGMRIALASHCYFLTTGRVPDRVIAKSRNFRVVAGAPKHGSVDLQFVVVLTSSWVVLKMLEHFSAGILEEAGKDFYKIYLQRHLRAWLKRYASREGMIYEEANLSRRIEPDLPWPMAESPDIKPVHETRLVPESQGAPNRAESQYRRLLARTDVGMTMAASPLGRDGGSSGFELRIDGQFIGYLGERQARKDARSHDDKVFRLIACEIERMNRE